MESSVEKSGSMMHTWRGAMACALVLAVTLPAGRAVASPPSSSSTGSDVSRDLFTETAHIKNDVERYRYLRDAIPQLQQRDRLIDQQLLSTVEDELGLYDEAINDFPFDNRVQTPVPLPPPSDWQTADAASEIAKLATNRRIVMINEAHHDGHTRELTLALLPLLRAEGFNYFAAEALSHSDTGLMERGYPISTSGTEYLHEPIYGEIIREAIRLGFVVVAYDSDAEKLADREMGQANQLYLKVFAKDPKARLFVHAGYAHIDKAPGNLGDDVKPMAMQLKLLSGFDPLTIDQTRWRDIGPMPSTEPYNQLISQFPVDRPSVLINRQNGSVWTSDPARHDVDVLLPRGGHQRRPHWLALGGVRETRVVTSDICVRQFPCVVEARYANESDDAIPADRYLFLTENSMNTLYLKPGKYKLRASDREGRTTGERTLTVDKPGS